MDNCEKIKLAIADDYPLFLKGLEVVIDDIEDIDLIFTSNNGKELIEKIEHQNPDVILMDLKMPVMDGLEATAYIKQQYPDIRIIVFSFHDGEFTITKLMNMGANGFLRKNADIEEITTAIYTVIQRDVYYNEYVSKAMQNGLSNKQKVGNDFVTPFKDRELETLKLICEGYTTAEIADKIFLSPRTVDGYRNKLMEKLGVNNTASMIMRAIAYNLLDVDLNVEIS